ncbi:MAG: heparinase [Litorilinea sp.]|nr:MAG: heparinase [Litorilinea sp.]GIV80462.1 MAG: heparinase [Litorilinea sp.]
MLAERYPEARLAAALIPRDRWHPYPTASQRDAWEALPDPVRAQNIRLGEALLNHTWPALSATLFLEYVRIGNRRNYERQHFARRGALGNLVVAECLEGKGRFLDDIVNGIWALCEESYWGVPAHVRMQRAGVGLPDTAEPTVDLFAAETGALLAWCSYLLGPQLDSISPLINQRIQREVQQRILTPCLERDDFWWMGFGQRRVNNWNPWVNSNWLTCTLLLEADPARRLAAVAKILRSLDKFIDPYPRDGGCDEGPSYWGRAGASLFDCLELLHSATDGEIHVYDEPLIQEIGRFIYRVQIADDYYINFADAPALVYPDGALIYRYGQRIGDPEMMALGAWRAAREWAAFRQLREPKEHVPTSMGRRLPALFLAEELQEQERSGRAYPPLPRDVWLPEIQVMVARDQARSSAGLFVAAKGGHNEESHNHNDVGNAIVYVEGRPVIVDAGVETYTAKTFSAERYTIWTMQSAYHTLPTIDGVMQAPGRDFAARDVHYSVDEAQASLHLDIAGAYPPEAKLERWARTVTLHRGREVVIQDGYRLTAPAGEITLSLVTPCQVEQPSPGVLHLTPAPLPEGRMAGAAQVHYGADAFQVELETIPIHDERLGGIWGDHLTRVILRAVNPPQEATWALRVRPL